MAMVTTGSTLTCSSCHTGARVSTVMVAANQGSQTAKTITSTVPMTNSGTE